MSAQPENQSGNAASAHLASLLRRESLRRGWDTGELVRRTGLARTTLYHLQQGTTQRPHVSTLTRIAEALEIPAVELWPEELDAGSSTPAVAEESLLPHAHRSAGNGDAAAARDFDRCTNPLVPQVCAAHPGLFTDWSPTDWDELFSTFGVGGELSEEGVLAKAQQMNRKRELVYQLEVVLETHLAPVATQLVETLFQMTQPGSLSMDAADPPAHK